MKALSLIILLFTLAFGADIYRVVSYEGADLNNHVGQLQLTDTHISEITVSDYYIELKGMDNKTQIGTYYTGYNNQVLNTTDYRYYYFIATDTNGDLYSITLEILKKLVVVNLSKDMIEIYHLEYTGEK